LVLSAAIALAGCREPVGDYLPLTAMAHGGFVTDQGALAEMDGRAVQLGVFVDHGNLCGDEDAKGDTAW
jgi:hypothetical protein